MILHPYVALEELPKDMTQVPFSSLEMLGL